MFPTTPRNDPYFRRYAGPTDKLSSPLLNKDNNSNGNNTTATATYNGLVNNFS